MYKYTIYHEQFEISTKAFAKYGDLWTAADVECGLNNSVNDTIGQFDTWEEARAALSKLRSTAYVHRSTSVCKVIILDGYFIQEDELIDGELECTGNYECGEVEMIE